ncbi:hypothetical protein Ahy_B05g078599 [Arachis hypogaea]|uniref:Aminotransferase-like plant mobile domain-containing protein n=1 Tax=Arachis hypogaea TaxID=3818 RepID=A0A444Z7I8_ARAHY|nr:hypothetical protein Ahy_B05g078599 [Arachis hypogaea]
MENPIPSARIAASLVRILAVVVRWAGLQLDNDRGDNRLRTYKSLLNGLGILNVDWTPYADPEIQPIIPPGIAEAEASAAVVFPLLLFAVIEWHQIDRAMRQFGGLQHIPTKPLNNDDMHGHDGRLGRSEWSPEFLEGWHELWYARRDHMLQVHHAINLRSSRAYLTWYFQWAHIEHVGQGDQHLMPSEVVPDDLPIHNPDAPELHQPENGKLPEVRL